jgi:hypothetical protein
MAYSYVVTSQKPTAVHHSLICNFTAKEDVNLIIAKGNHLEVYLLKDDGLVLISELSLFGKVSSLDHYRPANSTQDALFVLSERKHFTVLIYDIASKKIIPKATGNVKDRVGRDIESGHRGFIDPEHRMIAMLLYEGLLKVGLCFLRPIIKSTLELILCNTFPSLIRRLFPSKHRDSRKLSICVSICCASWILNFYMAARSLQCAYCLRTIVNRGM